MKTRQIILKKIVPPPSDSLEQELEWVCKSLGFVSGRDIDEISLKIFETILHLLSTGNPPTSEQIARELDIARGRVNHHLRNYICSGFLLREKNRIYLRGGTLKQTILELKKDADRIFSDLLEIAEEIDQAMGIKTHQWE